MGGCPPEFFSPLHQSISTQFFLNISKRNVCPLASLIHLVMRTKSCFGRKEKWGDLGEVILAMPKTKYSFPGGVPSFFNPISPVVVHNSNGTDTWLVYSLNQQGEQHITAPHDSCQLSWKYCCLILISAALDYPFIL